jgi:parvulin-like peptidyl-prolyl isomerase
MSFFAHIYSFKRLVRLIVYGLGLLLLVACARDEAASSPTPLAMATIPAGETTAVQMTAPVATPTDTAVPPTPTPTPPLAATVNGAPILLTDYEAELARYEQAQGQFVLTPATGNYRRQVLDALIERELIAQAAEAAGIVVTPEMVADRLAELQAAAGGVENFQAWLNANQWTETEFQAALAQEMVAGLIRDQVTADVPRTVEQVNARYIQVDDAAVADNLRQRALAGDDFAFLAQQNSLDRVTGENGGELGFFARGSLLVPAVEEAAFALQPGEVSEVIAATAVDGRQTFYIVQVIAREPQRRLEADMLYTSLQTAFESWLAGLWQQADVMVMVNTEG